LPEYLAALKKLQKQGVETTHAATMAATLGLEAALVAGDLHAIDSREAKGGRIDIETLIRWIERLLGCNNMHDAVLIGAGDMGRALLANRFFQTYGVDIAAAFDMKAPPEGWTVSGKPVYPMSALRRLITRLSIRIGIIAVPADAAQTVCDLLIQEGVRAIWNFAPVQLRAPKSILIKNENLAASLGLLSKNLEKSLRDESATRSA
jgi:redox-sensing transcriptional repressor